MFITPAYAADGGQAADAGGASFLVGLAPMLIIFVIFYFLLIRPQQKRMKTHQSMLSAVKRNDTVITNGGLIGKVTRVDEAEVEVELAPNVRVRVVKGMIAEVRQPGGTAANDVAPAPVSGRRGKRANAASDEAAGPDLSKPSDND